MAKIQYWKCEVKSLRDYFKNLPHALKHNKMKYNTPRRLEKRWRRFEKTSRRFRVKVKTFFSRFENSCHSLHDAYNTLIINTSPCNDKQKCHVTHVTFVTEWHQLHEKNKHIARGVFDIQRFMITVQWVQWDFESKPIQRYRLK